MKKILCTLLFLFSFSNVSFAGNCTIDLEANGMMQFSTNTISIDSSCEKFTINLKNTGTLDVNLAGHNVVISKKADFNYLTSIVNPSNGIGNGYLPDDKKVIYKTKFLGPNETFSLILDTNKFVKGQEYIFWCSFLGHWGVMNGTITLS